MTEDYRMCVGKRLKQLRKKRKLTVQSIIERLDVARSTYTGWELGRRAPNGEKLVILADVFDTTVDYLTGKTENEYPSDINVEEVVMMLKTPDGRPLSEQKAKSIATVLQELLRDPS